MSILKIGGDSFATGTKKGIMVPDANGYYDVTLGGLNVFNSAGEYYSAAECLALFNESSSLIRRIKKKALFAENGHPVREPGMSMEAYYNRVMRVLDSNVCAHISEITLDMEFGRKNPNVTAPDTIAIMGKIIPYGPMASVVEDGIKNPMMNLAFSKRTITRNENVRGTTIKHLKTVITFDKVLEGGIVFADKQTSPSLESFAEEFIDKEIFKSVLEESIPMLGFESAEAAFHEEVLEAVSKTKETKKKDSKIFLW